MAAKTMPATAIQEETTTKEAEHKKIETEKRNTCKCVCVCVFLVLCLGVCFVCWLDGNRNRPEPNRIEPKPMRTETNKKHLRPNRYTCGRKKRACGQRWNHMRPKESNSGNRLLHARDTGQSGSNCGVYIFDVSCFPPTHIRIKLRQLYASAS